MTYEYECTRGGTRFELRQRMADAPVAPCPAWGGDARRLISGGSGFILKGGTPGRGGEYGPSCSLEEGGKTCCGRDDNVGRPPTQSEVLRVVLDIGNWAYLVGW